MPDLQPVASLLGEVKTALRISNTVYDGEVETLIAAARLKMKTSGVSAAVADALTPDPLVRLAIVVYCKANFGLDNPDSEKFMASFESIVVTLALASEYQQPSMTGITGSITAGSDALTVSSVTAITGGCWLTIAGAGAGGALLIAEVTAVVGSVVTLDSLAGTTVASAAVTVR